MRLLMLNNEFPPLGGGTGTVNRAILQRFAASSALEIDLVTSALGDHYEQETFAENIQIFKVPVHNRNIHHSSNRELLAYSVRALTLAWKRHRDMPYDFCFAWSAAPAGGVALTLSRLCGLPYLVRVCGSDIPGFERRYRLIYPLLTPLIRAIWSAAGVVVAKCESEADMIHRVDPGVRVMLVPNGVDLAAFNLARILDDGPLRLLCVARLIIRKGQRDLLLAISRLIGNGVDVTLDLVGTGDALVEYQALAADLNVAGRVNFVGYVPREQIAAHYAAAHVFVLASYNEGMSVATLEAMAAGLPVVVTKTGGTVDLVAEGVNGFTFDWGDVDKLVIILRQLAADRNLARRLGQASRQRAEKFSWDPVVVKYRQIFYQFFHHQPLLR